MSKNIMKGKPGSQFIIISLLVFFGISAPLTAQATWSGNATVEASEFVNFVDDIPLAGASSSFTRNTVVVIKNPLNNKTAEVTIVKRSPRPGVFMLLSEEAGRALSMSEGQTVQVEVQVAASGSSSVYDEFKSSDPDINPAVTVPSEAEESESAPLAE
ncbi:MAG: hypothetical protein PQJ58_05765, partial [Spirochaetales bacterium]|nr:hypothetical protein [Spirochaetales bacterium]